MPLLLAGLGLTPEKKPQTTRIAQIMTPKHEDENEDEVAFLYS